MGLTVLMSVYNDSKYLKKSLDSILSQTYKDFIFLIFDDYSTDGSREILKEYAEKDDRIQLVLNNTNKGLSYNLARGIELCRTPLIARMDADDIAVQNRLEKQIMYFKAHPDVDVVGSYTLDIDENDNEIELRKMPKDHERIASLIWTCPFVHPTVMFKKDSILKAGSYNDTLRRRQDYELWFRCLSSGLKFYNISEPLLYYRCTDSYYKKNNIKVQLQQLKMGFKGSKLVNANAIAYFGIGVTFIKGILPYQIRKPLSGFIKKVDPRRK